MDRSGIATAARDFLHEVDTIDVTTTVMYRAINRSLQHVNRQTGYNRGDVTVNMQTGVWEYALSPTAIEVFGVRIGTGANRKKLAPTTRATLDREEEDWEAGTAGTPGYYYLDGQLLGVKPKPHGTAAGTTLYVRCVKNVAGLSAAASVPTWLPYSHHITVAKGAAIDIARGFSAEGEGSPARVQALYAEYLDEIREIRLLANGRTKEVSPTLSVTGYSTFRRK